MPSQDLPRRISWEEVEMPDGAIEWDPDWIIAATLPSQADRALWGPPPRQVGDNDPIGLFDECPGAEEEQL